jgi:hypothetical protein
MIVSLPVLAVPVAIAFVLGCSSSRKQTVELKDHDPRWARIDSLHELGQYATALELTDTLLRQAQVTGDWRTEFRAWMYRGRAQQMIGNGAQGHLSRGRGTCGDEHVAAFQLLHSVPRRKLVELLSGPALGGPGAHQHGLQRAGPRYLDVNASSWRRSSRSTALRWNQIDSLKKIPVGELGDLFGRR